MSWRPWVLVTMGAIGLLAAGCGSDSSAPPATTTGRATPGTHATVAPTASISYVGRDYEFSGPTTVTAGAIRVTMQNVGREYHNLTLARVADGVALPTDRTALGALFFGTTIGKRDAPVVIGGIHAADPGQSASTVVELRPGQYVLACDVADNQANFHFMRGMITTLIVTP